MTHAFIHDSDLKTQSATVSVLTSTLMLTYVLNTSNHESETHSQHSWSSSFHSQLILTYSIPPTMAKKLTHNTTVCPHLQTHSSYIRTQYLQPWVRNLLTTPQSVLISWLTTHASIQTHQSSCTGPRPTHSTTIYPSPQPSSSTSASSPSTYSHPPLTRPINLLSPISFLLNRHSSLIIIIIYHLHFSSH